MLPAGTTLYFVRHGETDWNAEGRLQGQQDIALNNVGRRQAKDVAHRLRDLAIDASSVDFIASPMNRTRETMEILRREMGLDPSAYRIDDDLKELTFGIWEGRTWKEVKKAEPEAAAARKADKWGFVPPGGGESYAMLTQRIARWLPRVKGDSVVVAHGGVARALLHLLAGIAPIEAPVVDIWQGRVLLFRAGTYAWV